MKISWVRLKMPKSKEQILEFVRRAVLTSERIKRFYSYKHNMSISVYIVYLYERLVIEI